MRLISLGFKFLLGLQLIFLLNSCTTVAYNTADVINSQLSLGTRVQDNAIKYQAMYRLHGMPYAYNKNFVEVVAYDRRLILLGEVENQIVRSLIDHGLASIPDVYRIDDYLRVGVQHSWTDWSKDAVITGQVQSRIFVSDANHFHYDIHTCDGVVYLFGAAPPEEEKYIISKVRVLPGVKKVVTIFPLIYPNKAVIISVTPVALNT